jgi:hypothetical protein
MKPLLKIIFLCSLPFCATAQVDTFFRFEKTIPVHAVDFTVDNLDNIYILTKTDQLKKLNTNGDSIAVYNDVKRFGKIYTMDVSNPLKIVLFYKSYSTIVILDRLLSFKGVLDLRKHKIPEASAAAASYDNNIWVFDAIENKLKKLDENGKLLLETSDLRQALNISIQPEKIIDQGQSVYLYDPKLGVFVFDHYGTYRKKFPLSQWTGLSIRDKQIYGISNNALVVYNTSNYIQQQYQFPSSFGSFNRYMTGNTKLFTLGKDSISIYNFRFNLQ